MGAVVQLMRSFGWERVMVLSTDKPWASDTAAQFSSLWSGVHSATGQSAAWTGRIAYSGTITSGELRSCYSPGVMYVPRVPFLTTPRVPAMLGKFSMCLMMNSVSKGMISTGMGVLVPRSRTSFESSATITTRLAMFSINFSRTIDP